MGIGVREGDRVRTPVLVLGGGPSGLATALELCMHDVEVVVVEPRTRVRHGRPRAKTTSARTMELFRRWGVAQNVRQCAALPLGWSDTVTFCSSVTGHQVTSFTGCFGLDLAGSDLVAEAGQQVTQPVIEEVLRAEVKRRPSVELMLGWRGVELEERDDHVLTTIESETGERRKIEASYVVGAEGASSIVRPAMGARYEGAPVGRPNVNITFHSRRLAELIPHGPSIHFWVLDPASPGVVGPLDLRGTWWAISTGTASVADDAEAAAIVRRLVGTDDVDVEVLATDPWQAQMLLADTYRRGRLFLVGDAAHQNPPWGGHGFNTGVGDAMNLGWKLAAVVNRWAPQELLDTYGSERRPIAQQTIDVAAANMGSLSVDLADPALMAEGAEFEEARKRAAAVVARTKDAEFHSLGLVLGYGYTEAARTQAPSLAEYRPEVAPGNRLPHRWLQDGESLFDRLGPGLTLFGPLEDSGAMVEAAASRGVPLTLVHSSVHDLGQHLGARFVLVRPDQHIAWTGQSIADAGAVLDRALRGVLEARRDS